MFETGARRKERKKERPKSPHVKPTYGALNFDLTVRPGTAALETEPFYLLLFLSFKESSKATICDRVVFFSSASASGIASRI